MKKTSIPSKPVQRNVDAFVTGQAESPTEKPKRLTINLEPALHRRFKMSCAGIGVEMAEEIRRMIEERFPA